MIKQNADKPILITGATGNVGTTLVKILQNGAFPLRAAVRSTASAARLPDGVPWVRFDFTDPATFPAAFDGIERMFLIRPPQIANIARDMQPALDYAAAAGVQHIVFLSLLGAERNRIVPHAKIEQLLQDGPFAVTLLRAGFFMQNLSTTHRVDILEEDALFIPAGRGKTAFIDTRDIAAVAALALTEPGHAGKAYSLTGAEALEYGEVAAMLTATLGRTIRYRPTSLLCFVRRLREQGNSWGYAFVVSAIYLTTRLGLAATITPHTAQLLGRSPRTMAEFVRDFAPLWIKEDETAPRSPAAGETNGNTAASL